MYQSYVSQLAMELELRGYSPMTVSSYSKYLQRFLSHTNKSVSEINEDDLRYYLHSLVSRKVSTSHVNSVYSSTQPFFMHVLKRPLNIQNAPRVKNFKKIPPVLSPSEVAAILMTAYSDGLRRLCFIHIFTALLLVMDYLMITRILNPLRRNSFFM